METQPMKVWWLSYSDDEGAKGLVIVEAETFLLACARSKHLKLSPGGQVIGHQIPPDVTVHGVVYRNRFYSPKVAREIAELY